MDKCRNFKVYINQNGEDEINDWVDSMPPKFRAKIRTIIGYLEITPNISIKHFKSLQGYSKLYELRFEHNNIQYRPLGCFGPGKDEFIVLILAFEIGDEFSPKDAPEKALERFKLAQKDRRYIGDFI